MNESDADKQKAESAGVRMNGDVSGTRAGACNYHDRPEWQTWANKGFLDA